MVENVHTGGVMQFRHEGTTGRLDDERKRAIEQGYLEAEERKRRERKQKFLLWLIVGMVIVALVLAGIFFFNN